MSAEPTTPRTSSVPGGPTCARLWGVGDVATFLGVPVATLYQWRHRGAGPPAMRIGRYLRFDPDRVRAWAGEQVR